MSWTVVDYRVGELPYRSLDAAEFNIKDAVGTSANEILVYVEGSCDPDPDMGFRGRQFDVWTERAGEKIGLMRFALVSKDSGGRYCNSDNFWLPYSSDHPNLYVQQGNTGGKAGTDHVSSEIRVLGYRRANTQGSAEQDS